MGRVGSSKDATKAGMFTAAMDIDDDDDLGDVVLDPTNSEILEELGEDFVKHLCKKASMLFFDEYGLISHQINSFNHFVHSGLVYVPKKVRSDKFKTGKEEFLDREIMKEDEREIIIGRLPFMVKSDICWMKDAQKDDCEFDHGGYFIIKGAEKTFIA